MTRATRAAALLAALSVVVVTPLSQPLALAQSSFPEPACFSEDDLTSMANERAQNAEEARKEVDARRKDAKALRDLAEELEDAARELKSDTLVTELRTAVGMTGTVVDGACELISVGTSGATPADRVCASWKFGRSVGAASNSALQGDYLEGSVNLATAASAGVKVGVGGELSTGLAAATEGTLTTADSINKATNGDYLATADQAMSAVVSKVDVLTSGPAWPDEATKAKVKSINTKLSGSLGAYKSFRETYVLASELSKSVDTARSAQERLRGTAASLRRAADEMDEKARNAIPPEDSQNPFADLSTDASAPPRACDSEAPETASEAEPVEPEAPKFDLSGLKEKLGQNADVIREQNEFAGNKVISSINSGQLAMAQDRAKQTQRSVNSASFGQTMQALSFAAMDLNNNLTTVNADCAAGAAWIQQQKDNVAKVNRDVAAGQQLQSAGDMYSSGMGSIIQDAQRQYDAKC